MGIISLLYFEARDCLFFLHRCLVFDKKNIDNNFILTKLLGYMDMGDNTPQTRFATYTMSHFALATYIGNVSQAYFIVPTTTKN